MRVSVAIVIQHATRMRRMYFHLWPDWLYHIFAHYLTNGTNFGGKKVMEHNVRVLIFCAAFETFLTRRRIPQDTAVNFHWSSRKVPAILVILKRNQNILVVRAELCHADGRTDRRHT